MSIAHRIDTLPGIAILPGASGAGTAAARDMHQFAQEGGLTTGEDFSLLSARGAGGDAVATLLLPGPLPEGFGRALARDGAVVTGARRDFHLPVRLGVQAAQRTAGAVASWQDYPVLVLDGWDDMAADEARYVALVEAPASGVADGRSLHLTTNVPRGARVAELAGAGPADGWAAVAAPEAVLRGELRVALLDQDGDVVATYPEGPATWTALLQSGGHLLVDARGRLELLGPRSAA